MSDNPKAADRELSVEEIVDQAREEIRAKADQDAIHGVLAAGLTPVDLTTAATFTAPKGTELPGEPRRLLLTVEVSSTRALGTRPLVVDAQAGEAPYLTARAFVRDLKADGTPHDNRHPHWVTLPDALVPTLLGIAHTS